MPDVPRWRDEPGTEPPADLDEAIALIEHLRHAVHARQRIGEAVGILMERYGLDHEAAFSYLVRESNQSNTKLRDVAAGIVADRLKRNSQE